MQTTKKRIKSIVALLRDCAQKKDLRRGTRVHNDVVHRNLLDYCVDALITMYAKCGAVTKARELFDMHKTRDVRTWTALIAGYVQKGWDETALNCFELMLHAGLSPDAVTFICILKSCSNMRRGDKVQQIHDEIVKQGMLGNDVVLGTALVDLYAKCGALPKAQLILDELPVRDVVSWSALIAGYAQEGRGEQALICYEGMHGEGLSPNLVTFICLLKACSSIGASDKGEQLHGIIFKQGLLVNDVVLGTALVDMYAKCGVLSKARQVLEALPTRDVVCWNALIAGYAQQGQGDQALKSFERMQLEGLTPDAVTFTCMLKACGSLGAIDKGEKIHREMARHDFLGDNIELGTSMVDMYAKCGTLRKAQQVLEELPVRSIGSWNALIAGFSQGAVGKQALNCYEMMQSEGISPNTITFTCILKACGNIGAVCRGEKIHDDIAKQGLLKNNTVLGNALVDMYAKCGAIFKAHQVLEDLSVRNTISWSTMISGYAQQGLVEQALRCFQQMQDEGIHPDSATFSCVLCAFGLLGLVENAQSYVTYMGAKFGMIPSREHYTSVLDLFGRVGQLDKAVEVIKKMPSFDNAVWTALLGACQKWGDSTIGRWAFELAVQDSEVMHADGGRQIA